MPWTNDGIAIGCLIGCLTAYATTLSNFYATVKGCINYFQSSQNLSNLCAYSQQSASQSQQPSFLSSLGAGLTTVRATQALSCLNGVLPPAEQSS